MNEAPESEARITLGLLDAVQRDSAVSQRRLSRDLGIALGLTNAYLKRCVRKGLIKMAATPANRYAYYVTPKGFTEKSRLTAQYLAHFFCGVSSIILGYTNSLFTLQVKPLCKKMLRAKRREGCLGFLREAHGE